MSRILRRMHSQPDIPLIRLDPAPARIEVDFSRSAGLDGQARQRFTLILESNPIEALGPRLLAAMKQGEVPALLVVVADAGEAGQIIGQRCDTLFEPVPLDEGDNRLRELIQGLRPRAAGRARVVGFGGTASRRVLALLLVAAFLGVVLGLARHWFAPPLPGDIDRMAVLGLAGVAIGALLIRVLRSGRWTVFPGGLVAIVGWREAFFDAPSSILTARALYPGWWVELHGRSGTARRRVTDLEASFLIWAWRSERIAPHGECS